ncbi:hypothetical protein, variant [Aphanomyces invadans]|uniref:Uncharacterized protein n=1 Tax=Aphanomyces invadans TaxID=157072 RepID=A0A024UEN9_9STRA|nr:hypothetical protein, variant [Aphanomyces invadans]ETW04675.1 hypothetical protein, variant [Aphanomyces invadans]|eukprot:XP_008866112.1 hypothetical protein, variant [Aphanomyces invadans]
MPVLRSKASKKIVASASSLLQCLEGLAKPSYAQQAVKFVHRSYCPNDIFVGIRVPQCREAVKTHLGSTTLKDILDLIHDARHEMRLTGFIALTEAFHRPHSASWWSDDGVPTEDHIKHLGYSPDDLRRHAISRIYLDNTRFCNNWDLVDASAHKILGEQLVHFHATELAAYCASPTKVLSRPCCWHFNAAFVPSASTNSLRGISASCSPRICGKREFPSCFFSDCSPRSIATWLMQYASITSTSSTQIRRFDAPSKGRLSRAWT